MILCRLFSFVDLVIVALVVLLFDFWFGCCGVLCYLCIVVYAVCCFVAG